LLTGVYVGSRRSCGSARAAVDVSGLLRLRLRSKSARKDAYV